MHIHIKDKLLKNKNKVKTLLKIKQEVVYMIRQGIKEDAHKIAKIKIDNWRRTYQNIFPDDFLEKLELNHETKKYLNNLENRNVSVYETEEPIAYCYYGNRTEKIFPEYKAEVFALYVKNDCQEHGVGTKLLQDAIKDLAKEHNKILLWCAKENTRAISFYQKNGLEIIGEDVENIGGKDVEKVALGINVKENVKNIEETNSTNTKNKSNMQFFYQLKKSANYIENEDSIAIYTNPDLIFLKEEPRNWFKRIIHHEEIFDIPQKFVNYLLKKEVI